MPTVNDVCAVLERIAPLELAEDWDNVGLLIGDGDAAVARVLTCLTLTPDVAREAIESAVQLVVSHHPVLFSKVQRLTAATTEGRMLLELITAGVAVYSPHTAYDSARAGINQQLAERLELTDVAALRPHVEPGSTKLVTFVPHEALDGVRRALWDAGCGVIGEYNECSFTTPGTGTFHGSDASQPAVGRAGRFESCEELRLEVLCPPQRLEAAIASLRAAHPYEEPAFDVYNTRGVSCGAGAGRHGTLPQPMALNEFNQTVKRALGVDRLQFVGDPQSEIRRVGVACGAAAELLRDAHRAGCQVLLTGEARFHGCLEARALQTALVLPGHYATERPAVEHLAELIAAEYPDLPVSASRNETDPVRWD